MIVLRDLRLARRATRGITLPVFALALALAPAARAEDLAVDLGGGVGLELFDTSGNVYEWCRDWYGASYAEGPITDPEVTTPPPGEDKVRRVLRGGSWLKAARNLRSAARYRNAPGSRNADNGFRVVASLEARSPSVEAPSTAGPTSPAMPVRTGPTTTTPRLPDAPSILVSMISIVLGAACCLGPVALVAFLIARARRSGKVAFRTGADGFWIDAPEALRGSMLHWQCQIGGRATTGSVMLEPAGGGQFVYTGATPSAVRTLKLERFGSRAARARRRGGGALYQDSNDALWVEQQRRQQEQIFCTTCAPAGPRGSRASAPTRPLSSSAVRSAPAPMPGASPMAPSFAPSTTASIARRFGPRPRRVTPSDVAWASGVTISCCSPSATRARRSGSSTSLPSSPR